MSDSEADIDLLNELADEYTGRLRRGETPSLQDYANEYPQLADDILELFPTLLVIERQGSTSVQPDDLETLVGEYPEPPERLGDYRLLREVGRGGMGVVYEAIQESLGRHVALKILPLRGAARPRQLVRFQREARVVAQLHHTNIVPVFAVGEADGWYYYAMQFIEGESLDTVLREVQRRRHLNDQAAEPTGDALPESDTLAQRLCTGRWVTSTSSEHDSAAATRPTPLSGCSNDKRDPSQIYYQSVALMGRQIAEALAYAHDLGVLHRDIKPSNLLLDPHGTIWVTDFGVARAANLDELTVPGDVVGTLRYVSPERFHGTTDQLTDVYGLGVTLYEMLAMRSPFDATDRAQLLHQILQAPVIPLRRFDPHVPRDLETIVLKAISRDPQQRYHSAADMAEDLQRFASDRPILARRMPVWERTWRWSRRNRLAATLTAVIVLLALAGVVMLSMSNLQIRREQVAKNQALDQATSNLTAAQQNYDLARQAIDQYLNRITSDKELESRDELHQLRRDLLSEAVPFFEQLTRKDGVNDVATAERIDACIRLGTLHRDLGDFDGARKDFQYAMDLVKTLPATDAESLKFRRALADLHVNLCAVASDAGRAQESQEELEKAIEITEQLAREFPAEQHAQQLLPKLQHNRAVLLSGVGKLDEALVACEQSIRLQSELVSASPDQGYYAFVLSTFYNRKGMLLSDLGKLPLAMEAYNEAAALQRQLIADTPDLVEPREALSMTLGNQATLIAREGDLVKTRKLLEEASILSEANYAEYPSVVRYGLHLANTRLNLGYILHEQGDSATALDYYRRAIEVLDQLVAQTNSAPEFIETLARAYGDQSVVLQDLGRSEETQEVMIKACQLLDELLELQPQNVAAAITRDTYLTNFGFLLLEEDQPEVSRTYFERAITSSESLLAQQSRREEIRVTLERARAGRARADEAIGIQSAATPNLTTDAK